MPASSSACDNSGSGSPRGGRQQQAINRHHAIRAGTDPLCTHLRFRDVAGILRRCLRLPHRASSGVLTCSVQKVLPAVRRLLLHLWRPLEGRSVHHEEMDRWSMLCRTPFRSQQQRGTGASARAWAPCFGRCRGCRKEGGRKTPRPRPRPPPRFAAGWAFLSLESVTRALKSVTSCGEVASPPRWVRRTP